jgi:hypothetical protein
VTLERNGLIRRGAVAPEASSSSSTSSISKSSWHASYALPSRSQVADFFNRIGQGADVTVSIASSDRFSACPVAPMQWFLKSSPTMWRATALRVQQLELQTHFVVEQVDCRIRQSRHPGLSLGLGVYYADRASGTAR